MRTLPWHVLAIVAVMLHVGAVAALEDTDDFIDLSLEELLNVEVTSVSKTAEKRTEAPAAIFVLTQEDIRRSGATRVPELLRLVPGLNVAQIDSSKWSVTSRGFGGHFSNKLLVLIDGRSIYTPYFSGVYWEGRDVMLEDVDRIEIIRGPGGALWGANAVNGVINIVTKSAKDTQGGLLSVGAGNEVQGLGSLRYGGTLNDETFYRVYSKYSQYDKGGDFMDGTDADDDWNFGKAGFRIDSTLSNGDELTVQGDMFRTRADTTMDLFDPDIDGINRLNGDVEIDGYNLLTRWSRTLSEDSDVQLQVYYDWYRFKDVTIEEDRGTFDIDFQHRIALSDRQELIWGLGYRVSHDDFDGTRFIQLDPDNDEQHLFSAFIQNRFTLRENLKLTLGAKIEHNDYTGVEIQPNARFAWTPNEKHTVWGAVSRAVRTPSRAENDLNPLVTPASGLGVFVADIAVYGSSSMDAEELIAYEAGYRVQVNDTLALDTTIFLNDYDELRSAAIDPSFTPPTGTIPTSLNNNARANTYGLETSIDWRPKSWWNVRASYSYLFVDIDDGTRIEDDSPEQQVVLQNYFTLPGNVEVGTIARYVDEIPVLLIDDYFSLDVRLGWRPKENLELALVGQNIVGPDRIEYHETIVPINSSEIQKGVYGKITWDF